MKEASWNREMDAVRGMSYFNSAILLDLKDLGK